MSEVRAVEADLLARAAQNAEKCRKSDAVLRFVDGEGAPVSGLQVTAAQQTHDYLFGCIIFPLVRQWEGMSPRHDEQFKRRFAGLFNLAVFPFYWAGYEHTQGRPQWQSMLPALEWCRSRGITAKGHPLAWAVPSGMPDWLEGMDVGRSEELLRSRVHNIVGGFAGQIDIWDVINEAVHVPTWRQSMTTHWKNQPWKITDDASIPEIADYVEDAFRCARAAAPQAHNSPRLAGGVAATFGMTVVPLSPR